MSLIKDHAEALSWIMATETAAFQFAEQHRATPVPAIAPAPPTGPLAEAIEERRGNYLRLLTDHPEDTLRSWMREVTLEVGNCFKPDARYPVEFESLQPLFAQAVTKNDIRGVRRLAITDQFDLSAHSFSPEVNASPYYGSVYHALALGNFTIGFCSCLLADLARHGDAAKSFSLFATRDSESRTVLTQAIRNECHGIAGMLLALKVNPAIESVDAEGNAFNSFHQAIISGSPVFANLARDERIDVAKRYGQFDIVALAACYGRSEFLSACIFLMKLAQPDWEPADQRYVGGNTLLHYAAMGDNPEVVYELLEQGCQATTANALGHTPLTAALSIPNSNADIVAALLAVSEDVNSDHLRLAESLNGNALREVLLREIERRQTLQRFHAQMERDFTDSSLPETVAAIHQPERDFD